MFVGVFVGSVEVLSFHTKGLLKEHCIVRFEREGTDSTNRHYFRPFQTQSHDFMENVDSGCGVVTYSCVRTAQH